MARYRIASELGRGGMGVVSEALDHARGREVALKRLSVERFATPRDVQRASALFEREYFTLAQLAHPHIIEVYDYGRDAGGPYYTMELLRGKSLREASALSFVRACSIARDVVSALALIHSRRFVHRDVTYSNIHCGADGRAKLIDFGALTPAGVVRNFVGTPAFVAPECLAQQSLDGRTDLYSLGVCLYFALTGLLPYPVRDIQELRQAWSRPPAPPSRLAAHVPDALDRLVLSLLSREPAGRPSTAAEVFERLTAIAELPRDERAEVARSYVMSPTLVGRASPFSTLRRSALKAIRGRGGAVLVEASGGMGRSRLLDAALLDAKFAGLTVLRVDATDATEPFGVLRRILRILLPTSARAARRAEESGLLEWVRGETDALPADREKIIRQADTLFDACSASSPLSLFVDDVHRIDEPSLSFIVSTARRAREHRVLVVTTADAHEPCRAAWAFSLLKQSSKRIELSPLDERETRALLSSLFGEVLGLDSLTLLISRACRGSPRELMNAVQTLADEHILEYEGGSWSIVADPAILGAALERATVGPLHRGRFAPSALDLVSALALDIDGRMRLADYLSLTSHGDAARLNRDLDELEQARLIVRVDDRYVFVREAYRTAVLENLDSTLRKELHRRVGERLAAVGASSPVYEAYHFLHAGLPLRAVDPIERYRDFVEANPDADIIRMPVTLAMLEKLASVPPGEGPSFAFRTEHGAGLVINATYQGAPERAALHAPAMLSALSFFTGLDEFCVREDRDTPGSLLHILHVAQARCETAGLASMNPVSAVRRLCQVCLLTAVCARSLADPDLWEKIPDLSPLAGLSPAVRLTSDLVKALGQLIRGQDWDAWDALSMTYGELCGNAGEQIDPLTRMALERVTLVYLCAIEAEHAAPNAPGYIARCAPVLPNLAESHTVRYCLATGNAVGERAARRQFEILSLQANSLAEARIVELPARLTFSALADDIMGLKRVLRAMKDVARVRPRWSSRVALARAHLMRCRGDDATALATIEDSLRTLPSAHGDWAASAALRIELLDRLGRSDEACSLGEAYLGQALALRVPPVALELALGLVNASLGRVAVAEGHFESAAAAFGQRGISGVRLGHLYEVGARIALKSADDALFYSRAAACVSHYHYGENPSLTAKYDSLVRDMHLASAHLHATGLVLANQHSSDASLTTSPEVPRPAGAAGCRTLTAVNARESTPPSGDLRSRRPD